MDNKKRLRLLHTQRPVTKILTDLKTKGSSPTVLCVLSGLFAEAERRENRWRQRPRLVPFRNNQLKPADE